MAELTSAAPCDTRPCRYWHNESKSNCEYPHRIETCASYTAELSAQEIELLRMLGARASWWPFEEAVDRAYVQKLFALYGAEINLVEKFYLWESYYLGKPARGRTNPRLGFHNWCIHGVTLKKRYGTKTEEANHPPQPPERRKETPGAREAGNAAPAAGDLNNVKPASGAPERVKRILAEAALKTGEAFNPSSRLGSGGTPAAGSAGGSTTPAKPLTPEELEARRKDQLAWVRSQKKGNANV